MRVYCLRHKVRPGDRLVLRLGIAGDREYLSQPILQPGTEGAILVDGSLVPYPKGLGLEVERDVSGHAILSDLEDSGD